MIDPIRATEFEQLIEKLTAQVPKKLWALTKALKDAGYKDADAAELTKLMVQGFLAVPQNESGSTRGGFV